MDCAKELLGDGAAILAAIVILEFMSLIHMYNIHCTVYSVHTAEGLMKR